MAMGEGEPGASPSLAELTRDAVIPVLRFADRETAQGAVEVVVAAGFTVIEVTLSVPGATDLIADLAVGHPGVLVGAGTVLTLPDAERCLEAGARFVVSPCYVDGLTDLCREAGAACLPGALTPTEAMSAWRAGATAVKVFPAASVGGPAHVKALRSVLPEVPLIPTGGVTLKAVPAYLAAGAAAVGVGGELIDAAALREGRREDAVAHAARFLAAGRAARSGA